MEKLLQPISTEAAKADVSRAGYCGSNDCACPTGVRLMVLHDAHASSTMASELADLGSTSAAVAPPDTAAAAGGLLARCICSIATACAQVYLEGMQFRRGPGKV